MFDEPGQNLNERPPGPANGDAPPPAKELLARISEGMLASGGGQLVHVEALPARGAAYAQVSPPLPEPLRAALKLLGIADLYTHQVEAIERVRRGENVVVVTATSSGKTLCYNLPVMEAALQDRNARALYLYPINALINDQFRGLFKINLALGRQALGVARYTGALANEERRAARARNPHIWLTNPEMLHLSFLLWHQNWEEFWRNLRFVVIDEVHTYRGVFGSNMAQLFRRMLRLIEYYGSSPQFICCSATIANPQELAENLVGRPFTVIDRDGAGRGRKYFALWNPPLRTDDGSNVRRPYAEESVDLLLHCLRSHYNTIVFARARSLTERMLRLARVRGEGADLDLLERISSYRAGYLADEREEIEGKLKTGEIRGIITTNALEMGIDIGGLDAAIISGYPGTVMSTWQQAGRAGRRGRDALVLLVASPNPLDQYYVSHPQEFFAQPHELAVVDLDNPYIRLKHLLCAARELPFTQAEVALMPAQSQELFRDLQQAELLVPGDRADGAPGLTYPTSRRDIHLRVSLRAAGHDTYRIIDEQRNEIGTIEPPNVFREAHPGAIYQHGGDDFRVTFLDRHQRVIRVREEPLPHYTRSMSRLSVRVDRIHAMQPLPSASLPATVGLGEVLVEETIYSYQELQLGTEEMVRRVNLDYPLTIRLHTTAMWLALSPALRDLVDAQSPGQPVVAEAPAPEVADQEPDSPFDGGLHALEHLLTGVMPLLVMCDQRDVNGLHAPSHPDLGAPAIFLYDAYEGGIGLADVAYQRISELLDLAYDTVSRCQCLSGCPSCIQSGGCRLRNRSLHKAGARGVLSALVAPLADRSAPSVPRRLDLAHREVAARPQLSVARALQDLIERTRKTGLTQPEAPLPTVTCRFAAGDRVEHSPYGRGVVLSSRLEGQREIITVRFAQRGLTKELDPSKGATRKVP